jgi:adenylate cyclase
MRRGDYPSSSSLAEQGGRIIDTAGDGILAEFGSVLGAVKCKLAIQKTMTERNAGIDPAKRMQFRIGINQGDVIVDDARVYGDGVNVAARIESIAKPGGICVSGKVHDEIAGKIDAAWDDLVLQSFKNIAQPIRVYLVNPAERADPAPMTKPLLALPDRPSIAVLPFTNLSGDKEQEYFSDGITEDIIAELSRFSELFVIARNSSFTYKGRAVDVGRSGGSLACAMC